MTKFQESARPKMTSRQILLLSGMCLIIFAIFIMAIVLITKLGLSSTRSESYKSATGAAGLSAAFDFACKGACDQKYNFNVHIFRTSGQQVAIVRPDSNGKVDVALPEGEYIMLMGRRFGSDKVFPEEYISLKKGMQLELKLHYGEVSL